MFLHAYQITFTHPETGKPMTLKRTLAGRMRPFLGKLGASEDLT
jgi:23S rRNA pseudouridine955/2504/2580 synthase